VPVYRFQCTLTYERAFAKYDSKSRARYFLALAGLIKEKDKEKRSGLVHLGGLRPIKERFHTLRQ